MTQQNKLYEAAMALIGDLINRRSHFNSFQNLCRILCEYEQSIEQPEAITGEKTARDFICSDCHTQWDVVERTISYDIYGTERMMERYASQQTSAKDKEIADLSGELHATDKLNQELQDEIAELKERISVIKEKLPDNKIRELNPIWVRDEIISELEKLI